MRPVSTLWPDILPSLRGVPNPTVERAYVRVAQEFCRETKAWSEWLEPIIARAGMQDYDLPLPTGAMVHQIEKATHNDSPRAIAGWRCADRPAPADGRITPTSQLTVSLGFLAATGDRVRVRAVLMPTLDGSAALPDELVDRYGNALASGTMARVMTTPGQPFTNLDLAAIHGATYRDAMATAKIATWRSNTTHSPARHRVTWC